MAREMHGLCSADASLRFHSQPDWLLPNAATALRPTRKECPIAASAVGNPLPSRETVRHGLRDVAQVYTLVPTLSRLQKSNTPSRSSGRFPLRVLLTSTMLGSIFQLKEEEIDVPANEAGQFAKGGALDSPPNLPKGRRNLSPSTSS